MMSLSGNYRSAVTVCVALLLLTLGSAPAAAMDGPASISSGPSMDPSAGNNTTISDPMLAIGTYVRIDTNWGDMVLGMYDTGAPITVSNFLNLTREGFYNSIKFHRIIDGFVIQTGDPNTKNNDPYDDGFGGSPETIPLEVSTNLTHIDGAVGMARSSDPNSASSQFYICDGPQHGLDGNYAVFAVVVQGMDTVRKISAAPTYGQKRPLLKDHPIDDIIMTSVSVWFNDTTPTKPDHPDQYMFGGGGSSGMEVLFWLGLVLIGALFIVLLVRRFVRRRKRAPSPKDEDVYEAELVNEDWMENDGSEEDGGPAGQDGSGWPDG
jgi:cyclophilin family peptidyl-prolyl cis-trans isomerase